MRLIDLSHPIEENMPVYPGTEPPTFAVACTVREHGFLERRLDMFSHTGTHMDAPAHMIEAGACLNALPLERFFGKAVVVDATGCTGRKIGMGELLPHEKAIAASDFVLMRTGWSRYWGGDEYFRAFPVLEPEAAAWLAAQGLSGVGVDAISVDPVEGGEFEVHGALLGGGLVIIENLTNLHLLPPEGFHLACFPLPLRDADGSPVRAVALLELNGAG
jgi:kynurenine formamidase